MLNCFISTCLVAVAGASFIADKTRVGDALNNRRLQFARPSKPHPVFFSNASDAGLEYLKEVVTSINNHTEPGHIDERASGIERDLSRAKYLSVGPLGPLVGSVLAIASSVLQNYGGRENANKSRIENANSSSDVLAEVGGKSVTGSAYGKRRRSPKVDPIKQLLDRNKEMLDKMTAAFDELNAKLNIISGQMDTMNAKLDNLMGVLDRRLQIMSATLTRIEQVVVDVQSELTDLVDMLTENAAQNLMYPYRDILARYEFAMAYVRFAADAADNISMEHNFNEHQFAVQTAVDAITGSGGFEFQDSRVNYIMDAVIDSNFPARKCRAARMLQDISAASWSSFQLKFTRYAFSGLCSLNTCVTIQARNEAEELSVSMNRFQRIARDKGLWDFVSENVASLLYLEAREYRLSRWSYPNGLGCHIIARGQDDLAHWREDLESKFFTLLNTNCNLDNYTMLEKDKQGLYQYFDPEWDNWGLEDKGREDNSCSAYVNKRLKTNHAVWAQDHYVWSRSKCWE